MSLLITLPEMVVVALGLALLLLDLWTPQPQKVSLGYVAAAMLGLVFAGSFILPVGAAQYAFGNMYVLDPLALFFKRFFLVAAILVLLMTIEYAEALEGVVVEYYALTVFALAGMMWAASANDFCLLFVAVELMAVTFYVLTSFQRSRISSLEAGVKYLILGATASAFLVYGIALIYGTTGSFSFARALVPPADRLNVVFELGLCLVLIGLGFKIAAFPFQMWVPDVYQGAPTPTTAFLAIGSKAAGFVLLMRVLSSVAPSLSQHWKSLLMAVSAVTILYGNLCAIPQRNLKRLLGYSSIANAGYLLLGLTVFNAHGAAAVLYYLGGYLFTLMAAFSVISVALRHSESEEIPALAGLHERCPLLAAALALAMISLAGIPPLAGFLGKFLVLKAVMEEGSRHAGYYWLLGIALVGVVISLYYYLGVVRALYWAKPAPEAVPIHVSRPLRAALYVCIAGMFYLGLAPNAFWTWTERAAQVLKW